MEKMNKFKVGNEVTFNTNAFNQIGFWKGTIYNVETVIDNVRVALTGYPKSIIDKKYLILVNRTQ